MQSDGVTSIQLAKTPKGAVNRIGPASNNHYLIWKFAKNIDGAKKFLIDYVNNCQKILLASKFLYLPCFPTSLPNFNELISNKPKVDPSTKYKALGDAHIWSTNVGYPGYMNPAIDEICGTGIIPEMFDRAATGEDKPEYVVKEAEEKCKYIYEIWKEKGLV